VKKFDTNYGVHANLGTAYHLLGRHQEAEKEIARDLEINPDAHFGLEKYHLALLQYLVRAADYQRRHVYVDEFTDAFLYGRTLVFSSRGIVERGEPSETNGATRAELEGDLARLASSGKKAGGEERAVLRALAELDAPPPYRYRWDLSRHPNLEEGVIYLASLNPREPACFVMLGVKSLHNHDLNLAAKAFERAIRLGSPQRDLLESHIRAIRSHIREARRQYLPLYAFIGLLVGLVSIYLLLQIRTGRRQRLARN